jgi:hypothetical protein
MDLPREERFGAVDRDPRNGRNHDPARQARNGPGGGAQHDVPELPEGGAGPAVQRPGEARSDQGAEELRYRRHGSEQRRDALDVAVEIDEDSRHSLAVIDEVGRDRIADETRASRGIHPMDPSYEPAESGCGVACAHVPDLE